MSFYYLFLILVIVLNCLQVFNCDSDAISSCHLSDRSDRPPNRCETLDDLTVEERTFLGGVRFWCIVLDNRRGAYSRHILEMELSSSYGSSWVMATKVFMEGLKIKFKLHRGINRFVVYSHGSRSNTLPGIKSLKLSNKDVCGANKRDDIMRGRIDADWIDTQNDDEEIFSDRLDDFALIESKASGTEDEYRFLTHCINNRLTVKYTSWCRGVTIPSNVFSVEQYSFDGQDYWCLNFEPDDRRRQRTLSITFRGPAKSLTWIPAGAYKSGSPLNSNIRSIFTVGAETTTVAAAAITRNARTPEMEEIKIGNVDVCDYYRQHDTGALRTTINPSHFEIHSTALPTSPPPRSLIPKSEIPASTTQSPQEPTCGKRIINQPITLITHGFKTREGEWPWHAAIYHHTQFTRKYVCGGSLIDRKTILTAAHCIIDGVGIIIAERISIELGRFELDVASINIQTLKVYNVIPHEKYSPETFENDIAVLQLGTYAQLNRFVQIICLPAPNAEYNGEAGQIVGWGRNEDNVIQNEMRQATMPIIDRIVCLRSNRNHFGQYLTETNFCAGYKNETSVCRGDSGSGLVFERDGKWAVVGVTSLGVSSSGTDLCDLTQYVLFTQVSKYVDWIQDKL